MFQSLKARIALFISCVLLPISIGAAVYFAMREGSQMREQASSQAAREVSGVLDLLTISDQQLALRVQSSMKLLQERSAALGAASSGATVKVGEHSVPELLFGGQSQVQKYELVDAITQIAGGTVTLFSKSDDKFVRVSTNVMKEGKRAVGTVLDPKGAAIAEINAGRGERALRDSRDMRARPPIQTFRYRAQPELERETCYGRHVTRDLCLQV